MRKALLFTLFVFALVAVAQAERPGYFSLSTARTYAPNEKPKLHLYTRNEDTLEFRVYRVDDPEKFFTGLPDLHRFGAETAFGAVERVDEETWLERFHDWKHSVWWRVRHFFRDQLSYATRDALREKQSAMGRRSRVLSEAEFAQIPVLNSRQLVSRWRLQVPPTFISDSQDLPIEPLTAGVYLIEATDGHLKAYTVLMVSEMAMLTRPQGKRVLAYCVDRKTGAPVAGADVMLWSKKTAALRATTDANGLAKIAYTAPVGGADDEAGYLILARHGGDVAAVTPWSYAMRGEPGTRMLKYIYTDRPVYRPGHTVHWKAILRAQQGGALSVPAGRSVHVRISSPEGEKVVFEKDMALSAMGSVNGDITLADNAALGYYTIAVGARGDAQDTGYDGSFYVEEYKKPEYRVTVTLDKKRVLQGEPFVATIEAKYFFGEPVTNAKVKYAIYHTRHFWWEGEGEDETAASPDAEGGGGDEYFGGEQASEQEGTLDANGRLTMTVRTRADARRAYDEDYRIEARVTDAAKREVSGATAGLATYGSFRINVEPVSWVFQPEQTPEMKVTAVDYDGKPVQTSVHLAAFRHEYSNGRASETALGGDVDVTTDASGAATVKMPIAQRGSIEVRATALTPEKRTVQASAWVWLVGGNAPDFGRADQQAQIVADKKTYKPGDVAHLSLIAQVDDPWVLVTTSGGTQTERVMQAHGRTLTFDVPITVSSQPNLSVRAVFLRENQVYQAQKDLKAPPDEEKLTVTITPSQETFQPQAPADYDVSIQDAAGNPVAAEFSFGVVDEALYAVRPDRSGDIVNAFYPRNEDYVEFASSLEYYFAGEAGIKSPLLAELRARSYNPRLAQVKPGNDLVQPKVRKAFPDTAFWQAVLRTDARGHARVTMQFPDSLTTWRTTVRAITSDTRGGSAVQRVVVRKNIIVRLAAPRFFRQGDEVVLPVIVHNYLTAAKTVRVSLDAAGVDLVSGATQEITVPSRGEATAEWRVRASRVGDAVFTAKALTNEESDAVEVKLPVEAFGVKETVIAGGVVESQKPKQMQGKGNGEGSFPFGKLRVRMTSQYHQKQKQSQNPQVSFANLGHPELFEVSQTQVPPLRSALRYSGRDDSFLRMRWSGADQSHPCCARMARESRSLRYVALRATPVGMTSLKNEEQDQSQSQNPQVSFANLEHPDFRMTSAEQNQSQNQNRDAEGSGVVAFPAGTDAATRELTISVAPSVAGSLFGALEYLTSYPYGCTEQTMSSFLPNIIVANALKSLKLTGVDAAELKKKVDAGSQRLYDYQHEDGGWGWWKEDASRVFMSAYVVAGFAQARAAGFEVQQGAMDRGAAYLRGQLAQHPRMIPELRAYVVYALTLTGERSARDLDAVWERRADLSAEGLAIAGLALMQAGDARAKDVAQMLEARVQHEGAGAYWASNYDGLMEFATDNSAEATAYALRLLTAEDAQSPLLAQAATWLVMHRSGGYWWSSTKQTAMVVYGLVDYLAHTRELAADVDAEVLVNGRSVGTRHFAAADAVSGAELAVTVAAGELSETNTIAVRARGAGSGSAGRLYWSAQGTYFTAQKSAFQRGTLALNLTRDYFKLRQTTESGRVVYRLEALNGPVASGDLLAVHLALSGGKWSYLLLEDPIPAGTEFVENESGYEIKGRPAAWTYWYTRREFHDDRAAIFDTEFGGKGEAFYLLKVVNAGVFQVSPASAGPMYQPDVQATSDALRLKVRP